VRPAGRNATFVSLDDSALSSIPGFVQVVQRGNFVAVVATDEWAAIQAAKALHVTWQQGAPLVAEADLPQALRDPANAYQSGPSVPPVGDVNSALAGASATLNADYFTPFQMHASIGPSCGVADVRGAADSNGIQATVWSGTQGVYPLQGAIAGLLGIPTAAVRVIYVEAAGCYGHNGADDAAADAALLSQAVGSRFGCSGCGRTNTAGSRSAQRWPTRCTADWTRRVASSGITPSGLRVTRVGQGAIRGISSPDKRPALYRVRSARRWDPGHVTSR
jgi:CO/xanthine dehydrogenase Mo-binding subunit